MKKRKQLLKLADRIHEHAGHALADWLNSRSDELMNDAVRLLAILNQKKK